MSAVNKKSLQAGSKKKGKGVKMKLNDITYAINGAVFEVNDILGPGFL